MVSKLHYISQEPHLESIISACEGGCDWIQLRAKKLTEEAYYQLAVEAKGITDRFSAHLVINDNIRVALKVGAYGVHLGKKDMDLADARKVAGPNLVIGGSTNFLDDILEAVQKGVDYLGLGPFRFTTTKTDLNPVLGLEGIAQIMNELHKRNIKIPIIAIGGIREEDIERLMQVGVYGVAVSGAITQAVNKKSVIEKMQELLNVTK